MAEQHTPEPWVAQHLRGELLITPTGADGGAALAKLLIVVPGPADRWLDTRAANARRIVACVNACAGIPTGALDAGTIPALIVALRNLVAADNCGYERDTMRYEGLFETARRILAYLPDESQEAPCAP